MKRSRVMTGAALLATACIGGLTTATSASAEPIHATQASHATPASHAAASGYNGACGSGYTVVNSDPVGSQGTVYLTYSSSTGENCVVTQRATAGKALPMVAWVQVADGGNPVKDSGNYTSYAGPVYVVAKGQCVNWGGTIDNQHVESDGTNCGSAVTAAR